MPRPWALLAVACAACASDPTVPPLSEPPYRWLSETGLYRDIAGKRLARGLIEFTVSHVLWSDGSEKRRFLRLPPGGQIDTSDPDHWRFPPGTQVWKEFSRDGIRLETRLIQRIADTGDRDDDTWVGAFLWLPDESDAMFVPDGMDDVRGTDHDVPSSIDCWSCHAGQPGSLLGVSAIQLAHDGPGSLRDLSRRGLLTEPPPDLEIAPPGDEVTSRALGYLHANCGHCHNPSGVAWPDTDIELLLSLAERTPEETAIARTTVGVPLDYWLFGPPGFELRVVPGDPDASGLLYRMTQRASGDAMPPLATEVAHLEGIEAVRAWIASL